MKLDDNTRAALHYLTLGLVVVLLLMVADRLLSGFAAPTDPAFASLLPFQHGYLLGDGVSIVDATSTRGERLAFAVVVAAMGALLSGLLVTIVLRTLGRETRRLPLLAARPVLVILLGWGIYAALFVPVHRFFLRDAMVVEWRYTRLAGELPVPFTKRIALHQGAVEVRSMAGDGAADLVLVGNDEVRLASSAAPGDQDSLRRQAEEAAAAINAYLRSH